MAETVALTITKVDGEQRIFTAIVYTANAPDDLQGDSASEAEVYMGMARYSQDPEIRLEHDSEKLNSVQILSNYMSGDKASGGIPALSWVVTGQVDSSPEGDIIWQQIKAGFAGEKTVEIGGKKYSTLRGFSMGGVGDRMERN